MKTFGCSRCSGENAADAWVALTQRRLDELVFESHFSIRGSQCSCGQRFVIVFTERIDWVHGEDDQLWLCLPVSSDELVALKQVDEDSLPGAVTRLGEGRRFLVRSYPSDKDRSHWWREGGFGIGPHD